MFDFGLQNHICYSIGNVHLAEASSPVVRRRDLPICMSGSSRLTTYSFFTQIDPAFRRAIEPAFMPAVLSICCYYHQFQLFLHINIDAAVEMRGFEPLTSAMQRRRSPN